MTKNSYITLTAEHTDNGKRLDHFLSGSPATNEMSRARLQQLIRAGHLRHKERSITSPSQKVKSGDTYRLTIPPAAPSRIEGKKMPLTILHEDKSLLVLNKPAGLIVHPGAGTKNEPTLMEGLLAHCAGSLSGIGGEERAGIVHRLDKNTSGIMVIAKNDKAHQYLSAQFAAHGRDGKLERRYQAIVWGAPLPPKGKIEAPIGRSSHNRTKMAVTNAAHSRHAITHYELVEKLGAASLIHCFLETGRTHQIRVHMAHITNPLLGDEAYGAGHKASASLLNKNAQTALQALGRQALHADRLGFIHPETKEPMRFEAAPPPDFTKLLQSLSTKE
ncbi:MAG: RluA family pseudouridine synthase [Parvibaculales bacterium]